MNRFQKLALTTAAATIVLFAVGGLVRGTGSGLGCSTWPECTPGQLFPSGTVHSLIEFSHRFLVFIVSVLVVATAVVAWLDHRDIPSLVWPATAAFPLVIGQAVLGGIVVHTDLNPWWVTAHFAVALAFVADVIFVAANAFCAVKLPEKGGVATGGDAGFARLTMWTVGATGALLLVGTYVRARSRRARVHGLAADERTARAGARRGGDRDVRPPRAGRRRLPAGALGRDPRAHDGLPIEGPGGAVHARALPVRGADRLRRAERVTRGCVRGPSCCTWRCRS